MAQSTSEHLRGDAAWRAELKEIAKRNEAACATAMNKRLKADAEAQAEVARLERREAEGLPRQPGR